MAAAPAARAAPQDGLWFDASGPRSESRAFIALLKDADAHGLDPSAYGIDAIETALATDPAQASALLDAALAAYARDLRVPRSLADVTYIDPELVPTAPSAEALAASGSPVAALEAMHAANPAYEARRAALAHYRATWGKLPDIEIPEGPTIAPGSRDPRTALLRERLGVPAAPTGKGDDAALGDAVLAFREAHGLGRSRRADAATIAALNRGPAHYEAMILADMDRLRGLPLGGGRYVLVDTATARLTMFEEGREAGTMRVVVGKPGMETPMLAGLIRFALVNPYWNVPPDLVRETIAPAVLREGPDVLARARYVLSESWQTTEPVDPDEVDWSAVAAGRESIWVRQRPGGDNMMGAVKFMLPNEMGIYLHDTPDKSLFRRADRRLSSGCVRLEDAARLGTWLFGRPILGGGGTAERQVDLTEPVPVFTTHLLTDVVDGRIRFRPGAEGDAATPSPGAAPLA